MRPTFSRTVPVHVKARKEFLECQRTTALGGGGCTFAQKHSTQRNAQLFATLKSEEWGEGSSAALVAAMKSQSFARHHAFARKWALTYT